MKKPDEIKKGIDWGEVDKALQKIDLTENDDVPVKKPKTPEKIKKGLECCASSIALCPDDDCPYYPSNEPCMRIVPSDALALIQQLEAQVPRWIPVEERLPEPDTLVLVGGYGEVASGFYHEKHGLWITHGEIDFTHWMPLPESPKEE